MSKKGHTFRISRTIEGARSSWKAGQMFCYDCGHDLTEKEYGIWCASCQEQHHVRNSIALSRKSRGVKNWYATVVDRPYHPLG